MYSASHCIEPGGARGLGGPRVEAKEEGESCSESELPHGSRTWSSKEQPVDDRTATASFSLDGSMTDSSPLQACSENSKSTRQESRTVESLPPVDWDRACSFSDSSLLQDHEDGSDDDDDDIDLNLFSAQTLPLYKHVTMDLPPMTVLGSGRASARSAFARMLRRHRVDLDRSRTDALYRESREQSRCAFAMDRDRGVLKRVVRSVRIRLLADIFGVEHSLYTRLCVSRNGQAVERRELPAWSLQWMDTERIYDVADKALYEEASPYVEDWVRGCRRALRRLGLSFEWQRRHLEEDLHLSTTRVEAVAPSTEYPGLAEIRVVHEVVFRVTDLAHPEAARVGLPSGQEFATTESSPVSRGTLTTVKIWSWCRSSLLEPRQGAAFHGSPIKRVPIPTLSGKSICRFQEHLQRGDFELRPPSPLLRVVQEDRTTDWAAVERMSRRIADDDYTLDAFYRDLGAFPELDLYFLEGAGGGAAATISGRSIGDEYQRTIGALFATYWLLRLSGDGRCGFCFGVDEKYRPIQADAGEERLYPAEKRMRFYQESCWAEFDRLLRDAGLLVEDGSGGVAVNSQRVTTLLALTAVHDIMKVKALLPTVERGHDGYNGYMAGDTIGDHDHALSYVMEYFPELLPSFAGLEDAERRSVCFTQCGLCFNHGWLVQAEAPPGAIFKRFREVLSRSEDQAGAARDIALYFVHWLTDLAGAEPTPLGGCEKFVIKFPLPVLNSFIRSFATVGRIATETETQVMEGYLLSRWAEHTAEPPTGPAAIAKMRLLCMAQLNAAPILEAFDRLSADDAELLSAEMAMTACEGQTYSPDLIPQGSRLMASGPALLIYYGPAFLQRLGSDNPVLRLRLLAQIYRVSRRLWPASPEHVGTYATIRIDAIQSLSVDDIRDVASGGSRWAVVRKNRNEAFVDRVPAECSQSGIAVQSCDVAPLEISTEPEAER